MTPYRRRRRRRTSFVPAVLVAGLMVAASLWMDSHGVVTDATVTGKRERLTVTHDPHGDWRRLFEVQVGFPAADGGTHTAFVRVDSNRYESIQRGEEMAIRYLPEFPLWSRPEGETTWSVARSLALQLAFIPILAWLVVGAVAVWAASKISKLAVVVVGVLWGASAFPTMLSPSRPTVPDGREATARVDAIKLIDRSPERMRSRHHSGIGGESVRRLAQPYQVVELRFVPPGAADSILAVDAVDSGSVAGLAHGALLPVRYDPADPRGAKLTAGTRHFVDRNRYHFLIPLVGASALGILAGLSARWRRERRRATGPARHTAAPAPARGY